MGFTGEIVVVQGGTRPADRGAFLGVRDDEFVAEQPLRDGWRAIHVVPADEQDKYDDYWLAEVFELTGAPVLACWVFDSEVAHVRGVSKAGEWDTWLNPPYAATMIVRELLEDVGEDLFEDGGQEAVDRFRTIQTREMLNRLEDEIPLAARKAAEWAAEAGYRVAAGPVEDLLSARPEAVVEWGVFKLLFRLGLRESDFVPEG
jgi:hypothetical protein